MNAAKKTSSRPPEEKRTKSGHHPAVREMRRKLESIDEGQMQALADLDTELQAYLESVAPPPDRKDPT